MDRPHAVQVNTRANDHGTTALAAPASSSSLPCSAPRQPPPLQPALLAPPSPSPPFAWPGGAQQGGADCRGHGLEGNAGGVTGGGLVGIRSDAGVGAEGPAAHASARGQRKKISGTGEVGYRTVVSSSLQSNHYWYVDDIPGENQEKNVYLITTENQPTVSVVYVCGVPSAPILCQSINLPEDPWPIDSYVLLCNNHHVFICPSISMHVM